MRRNGWRAATILIGLELGQLVGSGPPSPALTPLMCCSQWAELLSQAGLLYGARAAVTLNHALDDLNNRRYCLTVLEVRNVR